MFDLYTESLYELHDTVYDLSRNIFELARRDGVYNPGLGSAQVYKDILSEVLQALTAVYDEVKDQG